ncbi:MAG TPA: glycosyltransferase family 9 protein [Armatimonadota bacterium]
MASRTLICFPTGNAPGLRAEAAQLALGLAARGREVVALGPLGPWRHALRLAKITATEFALPGDERRLTRVIQEFEPQTIHAFGVDTAHLVLPLTAQIGAGGAATLCHDDLTRLNPTDFRAASAVFVPCDFLREQAARRLPATEVVTCGYLLPPPEEPSAARNRFLAEELGLQDGAPAVLLADHFHGSETAVAQALIEATPQLVEHIPGLQIIIAGAGLRLGELEQQAFEINDHLGYRAILLPGQRDDIQRLLGLVTVAVGSGRFALEAVGAGVALVAAGAAGIVGTFTEKSAPVALYSCCGRHGHLEPLTAHWLTSEIVGLFQYPRFREAFAAEGQKYALAQAGREKQAPQVAAHYHRATSSGTLVKAPQRMLALLPDDLRELLFCLPAVATLRDQFPLTQLQLCVAREHQHLLEHLDVADRVVTKPAHWRGWFATLPELCRPRPDVCVAFDNALPASLIAACSLAPHRLGFVESAGSLLLTDHCQAGGSVSPGRALMLLQSLNITACTRLQPPALPALTRDMVSHSLQAAGVEDNESLILLCPHAHALRSWHPNQWAVLMELLRKERPERIVAIDDGAVLLPEGVVQVQPVQDSLVLATLLARAELVIAADSGTLHLADLFHVPTIGLYGPSAPGVYYLPNPNRRPLCHTEYPCHPCVDSPCQERHCLRALTPAEVVTAVVETLGAGAVAKQ